jgi:hypothetical protein
VVGATSVPLAGIASAALAQEPMGGNGGMGGAGGATTTTVALPAADEQIVRFAETVERAAAAAYDLALQRRVLTSAAESSARLFGGHHTEHGDALQSLLGGAEGAPNAALVSELAPQIEQARDEDALIALLRSIETAAAATYFAAIGQLETAEVAGAASTILPVEAQHQVVWSQALGLPLTQVVPTFQDGAGALAP